MTDLLRFITCGSTDDGKSTLIGRLLHDSGALASDEHQRVLKDSATVGHAGQMVDLALLADGLEAEREQGITIDVAYRYFSTPRRSFVMADTPGHEQYTRNMATAASNAELAVVLVDASRGVTIQTRRHLAIVALLGVGAVVVAVNKMDLPNWRQDRFRSLADQTTELAESLGVAEPVCIPMSALRGDGVVHRGDNLDWYQGPCLLEHLETVDTAAPMWRNNTAAALGLTPRSAPAADAQAAMRLPVQLVIRPDHSFRGYAGTLCSGELRRGDTIRVEPSGRTTTIERIVTFGGDIDTAPAGAAITVTTSDELDIARGDVLADPAHPMQRAFEAEAVTVWMSRQHLVVGREYLIQLAGRTLGCRVVEVDGCFEVGRYEFGPAATMTLNDIAKVRIRADAEIAFDSYWHNRHTGSFILIDTEDNSTVAAGMIIGPSGTRWDAVPTPTLERRASAVSLAERSERYAQQPVTVLFTGLTCAGKSTLATALERALFDRGHATVRLDGENVRLGISRDLGFSAQDRSENVRRVAELARLVNSQGLIAVVALVAPSTAARQRARWLIGAQHFVEVYLDPPVEVCRRRDTAGLYAAADRGEISEFPGVSAPYDPPGDADLVLDTARLDVEACITAVLGLLEERAHVPPVDAQHGRPDSAEP